MRVAIVGPYPEDATRIRGGVEAVLVYLTEGLRRFRDLELHVVTLQSGIQQERVVSSNGLTVYYLPRAAHLSYLTFFVNRCRLRRRIASISPDVINAHEASEYAAAALQSHRPTVVTLHGIIHRELRVKGSFSSISGWPFILIERLCVRRARHIITISPYILEEFGDLVTGDVYPIENPISDKFFALEDHLGRETPPLPNRVLFAGILKRRKQVLHLLQAIAEVRRVIPSVQLRLAGDRVISKDGGGYFSELQEFISRVHLEDNVSFLGSLPEEGLLEEYRACSLLVLPSIQETSPMVVMQAMAAGKAVVSTRVGGLPHLVAHGETGLLVESGDVPALADAIVKLLQDDRLRAAMEHRGRQVAEERFRGMAVAERTREVYYRVAGRAVPGTDQAKR